MSLQQYFSETEAVVQVLSEYAGGMDQDAIDDLTVIVGNERQEVVFAAIWQAAELLSRAYSVLLPMVQFEQSKAALVLPDIQQEKPKTGNSPSAGQADIRSSSKPKKKAHLYGADGKPL